VPTVSRVLSGAAPVSSDKRRQVLRAIQELGYHPNAAARALVTGRRSIISVLTGDTTRYGYASTIRGIEEAARAVGLVVAVTVLDGDDDRSTQAAVDLALGQPLAGAPVPEVIQSDWTPRSGYEAGLGLAGRRDVTAVLCGNDEIAFGVIKALQVKGLRVPEDISVMGFDDHPLAEIWTPALTTMGQDFAELGRMAVDFLLGQLAGEPFRAPRSDLRLVVRDSTAPPRA
jgi:DNA-binding LacI/PurR family transcriptional regulator